MAVTKTTTPSSLLFLTSKNFYEVRNESVTEMAWHLKNKRMLIIIIGATLGVILLTFRLTLPYIIKNNVERELSKRLGTKITIGSIRLSLIRGAVTIRKLSINNPAGFDTKSFLTVQKIFVNIALTSLFSREIEIELVEIQSLALLIQRTKEGHFNFNPILEHVKSTSSPLLKKREKAQPSKGVFLHLFKVENAQISFEDYAISEPLFLVELKDIAIVLKSFRYPDASGETKSEINIAGQLVATKTSPIIIKSTFQVGKNLPTTIFSHAQEEFQNIYIPHFNPYFKRYGYIFESGIAALAYAGTTGNGRIDGLANMRFENVRFEKSESKLSALVLGIPLHVLPRLFQDPKGILDLTLEVSGSIGNPQVSWNKLSEQFLAKALGNTFKKGSIMLRKPFELIIQGITKSGKNESFFQKLKSMLNPQAPPEKSKDEIQGDKKKNTFEEFFKTKLIDPPKKIEKEGEKKE